MSIATVLKAFDEPVGPVLSILILNAIDTARKTKNTLVPLSCQPVVIPSTREWLYLQQGQEIGQPERPFLVNGDRDQR
jgi:hypothetical protein